MIVAMHPSSIRCIRRNPLPRKARALDSPAGGHPGRVKVATCNQPQQTGNSRALSTIAQARGRGPSRPSRIPARTRPTPDTGRCADAVPAYWQVYPLAPMTLCRTIRLGGRQRTTKPVGERNRRCESGRSRLRPKSARRAAENSGTIVRASPLVSG